MNTYQDIQIGDRITFSAPNGKGISNGKIVQRYARRTGTARMKGPAGWVISKGRVGYPHGICNETNFIKMTKGRCRREDHLGEFLHG